MTDASRPTRVLIVEDRLSHAYTTASRVRHVAGPDGRRAEVIAALEHRPALARVHALVENGLDVALIDAMRHPDDLRAHPGTMAFGGLEVAAAIADADPRCRIVGYSAQAHSPRVNVTFREIPSVAAVFDQALIVDHMAEALWSDRCPHQVPPPDEYDYAALGTTRDARIWEAIQFVRQRPDTWEAVARTLGNRGVEARTREHLNKYLPDLIPMPDAVTYRAYVEMLRTVAGFLDAPR